MNCLHLCLLEFILLSLYYFTPPGAFVKYFEGCFYMFYYITLFGFVQGLRLWIRFNGELSTSAVANGICSCETSRFPKPAYLGGLLPRSQTFSLLRATSSEGGQRTRTKTLYLPLRALPPKGDISSNIPRATAMSPLRIHN